MLENKQNINIMSGTDRGFGILFSIILLLIGLYQILYLEKVSFWIFFISLMFLLSAIIIPKSLSIFNKLWFKFGELLGFIVTPIIMAFIYLTTVVPTGLIIRFMGKDLLQHTLDKEVNSYWIERREINGSMKDQF